MAKAMRKPYFDDFPNQPREKRGFFTCHWCGYRQEHLPDENGDTYGVNTIGAWWQIKPKYSPDECTDCNPEYAVICPECLKRAEKACRTVDWPENNE
jgi:hypothetical protein